MGQDMQTYPEKDNDRVYFCVGYLCYERFHADFKGVL